MHYAMAYAETGHLCLSTIHANNANQALDRILTFFPATGASNCCSTCRSICAPSFRSG
jgi:Tfp pilus assembly ATPase PilU